MSNYNAGDIIRLTRLSIGISQEQLSENICSVQTLSRIENGKCRVKNSIYQELMEKMGWYREKSYAILQIENFDLLETIVAANTALAKHEYEKVEEYIRELKPSCNDSIINKQYIGRKEIIVKYRLGRLSREVFLIELKKLLSLTAPNFELLLDKEYPFMFEEVHLLISIANVYSDQEKFAQSVEVNNMLLKSLSLGYMRQTDAARFRVVIMNNMAKSYGGLGNYQMAIQICENAIEISKEHKLSIMLPNLLTELSWNMMQQINKGEREKKEKNLCKKYLRQGYAISVLFQKYSMINIVSEYYIDCFDEKIYTSSPF